VDREREMVEEDERGKGSGERGRVEREGREGTRGVSGHTWGRVLAAEKCASSPPDE
jgi:hypothetical protein